MQRVWLNKNHDLMKMVWTLFKRESCSYPYHPHFYRFITDAIIVTITSITIFVIISTSFCKILPASDFRFVAICYFELHSPRIFLKNIIVLNVKLISVWVKLNTRFVVIEISITFLKSSIALCFEFQKLNPLLTKWPMEPVLISGFCSVKWMRVSDSPGRDTNPSQVSSQQMLVLIYLPWNDRKLSLLRRKRSHKYSNLGKAKDRTGDLVARRQRSYHLRQPRPSIRL